MASGNFLIGENLSLKGFDKYVQPLLEKKGYSVKDKLSITYERGHREAVLTSIVGEGNLEHIISDALVETSKIIGKDDEEGRKKGNYKPIAWQHQVSEFSHFNEKKKKKIPVHKGKYEAIGVYHQDDVASKLFSSIAQEYFLENLDIKAEEVERQIKNILGKTLSEL